MIITIENVGEITQNRKGSNVWEECVLEYSTAKGKNKQTLRSFNSVFNDFGIGTEDPAKKGEVWNVTVKKEGDYWNWKEATIATEQEAADAKTQAGSKAKGGSSSGSGNASGGAKRTGDWETAEERALKQRYIVAQSSITTAVDFLHRDPDRIASEGVSIENVFSLSDKIFDYVMAKGKE